jgi:hypothetical protein
MYSILTIRPEEGSDTLLRNICNTIQVYMTSQHMTQHSTFTKSQKCSVSYGYRTVSKLQYVSQFSSCLAANSSSFQCPGVGIYPDPTDCHNFYTCDYTVVSKFGTCMDGTGSYDAESRVCRVTPCSGPPETRVTEAPAFTCTTAGVFADPKNCHNYFICDETLQPIPGTCMKGQGTFDPVNQVCTSDPCPGSISTAFVCPSSGFFADPEDCHGFYVCDANLNSTQSSCTSKAHFDPKSICVLGPCSQNLSTTTITAAPATSPTTPFACTAAGHFADPSDCRSYYTCDSNLNRVHSICMGGGGHFDANSEGCVAGSC